MASTDVCFGQHAPEQLLAFEDPAIRLKVLAPWPISMLST
jgi:hypothetical protein